MYERSKDEDSSSCPESTPSMECEPCVCGEVGVPIARFQNYQKQSTRDQQLLDTQNTVITQARFNLNLMSQEKQKLHDQIAELKTVITQTRSDLTLMSQDQVAELKTVITQTRSLMSQEKQKLHDQLAELKTVITKTKSDLILMNQEKQKLHDQVAELKAKNDPAKFSLTERGK